MNAGSDLYPREALASEEPHYLRRQKPIEIRRRKFGRRNWSVYRRWALTSAGLIAGGCLAFGAAHFFLFSPRVALASADQIEITGNRYVTREAIEDKFAADLGRSILRVPLGERRAALEAIPWIEQASVERALPNRLRVELTERVPVAYLRAGDQLALVDANGVILERPLEGAFHFPVAYGFNEATPLPERARRMSLFVEFLREVDLAQPGASDQVSEVNLADAQDLRATIAGIPGLDPATTVLVHFGNDDFVGKYHLLLENIGSWRESAGRIESVDLRFSKQVVVNPESETTAARATPPNAPRASKP